MLKPEWFAGRLKELRGEASLTQKELADKAGLTEAGIRNLEQGRTSPAWATVLALTAALGVDCIAFTQEPTEQPAPRRGRPRKPKGE